MYNLLTYGVKCGIGVVGMSIHRCNMTSLLVPLSVVIIGHYSNPIKVLSQGRNIVTC